MPVPKPVSKHRRAAELDVNNVKFNDESKPSCVFSTGRE